ncbi:DUF1016 N-terminal domain-containing protein [Algoriphagus boritolerans]|uniref:DUF1016 N-terminal domain-containing protein n=1 Tax=Algoriphagus boritolerans TaxID=308111 RepID=UPI000AFDBA6F
MTKQFTQIVLLIQEARGKAISAVNTELINVYWKVGAYISLQLQQAVWGEKNRNGTGCLYQKEPSGDKRI